MRKVFITLAAVIGLGVSAKANVLPNDIYPTIEHQIYGAVMTYSVNIHVEATLTNEEYNQQLYLYSDGSCVVRDNNVNRGRGTYNIVNYNKIYIEWNNGEQQQGSCRFERGGLRSVSIEGVTYSRKLVVSR